MPITSKERHKAIITKTAADGIETGTENMKQYSHNYTPVADAAEDLYRVTRLLANDCIDAALSLVTDARGKLLLYLSRDNMVEDNDVADGWVRASEVEELINQKEG